MKKSIFVGSFVLLLDQFSKFFAPRIGLVVVKNKGIAFGLFPNFAWEVVIFLLLAVFLVDFLKKRRGYLPLTLILAGGLSNLFDRLYFGYIRDFIDLKIWPVFNLADVAICLGVGMILIKEISKVARRPCKKL